MEKTRIIHIISDMKFIHNVDNFENGNIVNSLIFIGPKPRIIGDKKEKICYYSSSLKDLGIIIKLCKNANIVVLYELNFIKSYIANRLPKSVKIIWRFFGTELYVKISDLLHSEKTLNILKNKNNGFKQRFRKKTFDFFSIIKYGNGRGEEFSQAAFERADYFLGISELEYDFLKLIWPKLPPFLQLSISLMPPRVVSRKIRSNNIILGNNRRPYNNHLDIIDGLKNIDDLKDYKFHLMFNYGLNDNYTNLVRQKAKEINQVNIIEEFMGTQKFIQFLSSVDAFVMNGYRQMAMKNILIALQQNVKIYLNEKNIIYTWLKNNGLKVYTLNDFFNDLQKDNLLLSEVDQYINRGKLMEFSSKYNKKSFQESILKIAGEKQSTKYSKLPGRI